MWNLLKIWSPTPPSLQYPEVGITTDAIYYLALHITDMKTFNSFLRLNTEINRALSRLVETRKEMWLEIVETPMECYTLNQNKRKTGEYISTGSVLGRVKGYYVDGQKEGEWVISSINNPENYEINHDEKIKTFLNRHYSTTPFEYHITYERDKKHGAFTICREERNFEKLYSLNNLRQPASSYNRPNSLVTGSYKRDKRTGYWELANQRENIKLCYVEDVVYSLEYDGRIYRNPETIDFIFFTYLNRELNSKANNGYLYLSAMGTNEALLNSN